MVKVVPVTRITGVMSQIPLEDSNEKCHEVCSTNLVKASFLTHIFRAQIIQQTEDSVQGKAAVSVV